MPKTCSKCRKHQSDDQFGKTRKGLSSQCKSCTTDQRLRKTYGISLADYNSILEEQDGRCAICRTLPTDRRLHTDHDHSYRYVKVAAIKRDGEWVASASYRGCAYSAVRKLRTSAARSIKQQLQHDSVRGLLCARCNRGLQFYSDCPERFDSAAAYLRRFNNNHHKGE